MGVGHQRIIRLPSFAIGDSGTGYPFGGDRVTQEQQGQSGPGQPKILEPQLAAMWTLADVVTAYLCFYGGAAVGGILGYVATQDKRIAWILAEFGGALFGLWSAIRSIRRRDGLARPALGLRRGNLHPMTSVALGIGVAITYHLVVQVHLFQSPPAVRPQLSPSVLLLAPLSLDGFPAIVLGPLSEEVLHRGFLYGYLRTAYGSRYALALQAALFSLLHAYPLAAAIHAFLVALVLGLLYERTKSLYPSMVCHGTVNYLSMFSLFLSR